MLPWSFNKTHENKIELICTDLTIQPDNCNFSCEYCLSNEMPAWKENIEIECTERSYEQETTYGIRLNSFSDAFNSVVDAAILRISGGEVLRVNGIIDFFRREHVNHEVLQIITNGFYLNEKMLEALKAIPNCHAHMSLDGHNFSLNRHRVKSESTQEFIMKNLDNAVKMGFHIELGSVLTNINTMEFDTFLDYLLKHEGMVTVYPFPVRGDIHEKFLPDQASIESFARILERYEYYKGILPPKAYLEEAVDILMKGKRLLRCVIPKCVLQYFDDGNLTPCPNGWAAGLGNIMDLQKEDIAGQLVKNKIYSLFCQDRPRLNFCRHCFTSLDVINLYAAGRITDGELTRYPIYSGKKTLERMKKLRDSVKNNPDNSKS